MIRTAIVAIAATALASAAWGASAKHQKPVPHATAIAQVEQILGVNPMTNAPPQKAVDHPAPFVHIQGVNPM